MATEPTETTNPEQEVETEATVEEVKNPLEMSDEEFLKTSVPPKEETLEEEKTEEADKADNDSKPQKEIDPAKVAEPDKTPSEVKPEDKPQKGAKAEESSDKPPDYEGFFRQIMTPFKANGKSFEVKTPEEAVRLMQKGAGYGRKLQDMQPHLKVLRMLEKNDLLDESKLSYLIDINQKKPDAIKKLIKDSGIDTLDLNPDDKVTYTPTNHAVTDKEVAFHQALAEVQTQPGGNETLRVINQTWDQESKALLWESPELFQVIQTQRENGVFHQIATEIDRQKLLGTIDNTTPFLQAYKIAGDHLVKTNGFKQPIQTQPSTPTQQPQVIATRTATPKPQVKNGDRVAAAAPTKVAAAGKPNLTVNPLEMADDDFMKQFSGRF